MDAPLLFIVTHTTRYLDVVLAGLARQTLPPRHVVVSCDTDDPSIGEVTARWASHVRAPVSWVRRPHQGIARTPQVRNNAVRHLLELGHETGRVIQIDGDILCPDRFCETHATLGQSAEMLYPYRVNVDERASATITGETVLDGSTALDVPEEQRAALAKRTRRYRRQLRLRRLRLGPLHKPKLLGCNWSAPMAIWRRTNGFDEQYAGWGYADDDFARRAAMIGATCRPCPAEIIAFHLDHPTRQPDGKLTDNPNYERFSRRDLPARAERGLEHPIDQDPVSATVYA